MLFVSPSELTETHDKVAFHLPFYLENLHRYLRENYENLTCNTAQLEQYICADATKIKHAIVNIVQAYKNYSSDNNINLESSCEEGQLYFTYISQEPLTITPDATLETLLKITGGEFQQILPNHCQLSFPFQPSQKDALLTEASRHFLTNCHILVLDHDKSTTAMLNEYVNIWHMRYHCAEHEHDALAALDTALNDDDPYEIILIGDHLTQREVSEFAQKIQQTNCHPDIKLVILHEASREYDLAALQPLHVTALLQKPFTPTSLYQTLIKAVNIDITQQYQLHDHIDQYAKTLSRILLLELDETYQHLSPLLPPERYHIDHAEELNHAEELMSNFHYDFLMLSPGFADIAKLKDSSLSTLPLIFVTPPAQEEAKGAKEFHTIIGEVTSPVSGKELQKIIENHVKSIA